VSARPSCEFCGDATDVRVQLAWYKAEIAKRLGMPEVQTALRCMDHVACRQRVEVGGETWPLVSTLGELDRVGQPWPTVAVVDERHVTTTAEPESDPEPEEATSWFS
jgi:hypothetical protein